MPDVQNMCVGSAPLLDCAKAFVIHGLGMNCYSDHGASYHVRARKHLTNRGPVPRALAALP